MEMRSGKIIQTYFKKSEQPFKLILLKEKVPKYEVNIDFDGASKEWRKNKISVGNGQFIYQ